MDGRNREGDSNAVTGHRRDFPILAKLLAEYYEPVARTDEGVVYRMR